MCLTSTMLYYQSLTINTKVHHDLTKWLGWLYNSSMTFFRNLHLEWRKFAAVKQQQAPTTTAVVASGQHVPAVNMAEEILEAVEKLQLRLSENQEPRKVRNLFGETKRMLYVAPFAPCMTVLYALRRVSSLRFDQHCYLEIPRITITSAADREMDGLVRSIRIELSPHITLCFDMQSYDSRNSIEALSQKLVLSYQKCQPQRFNTIAVTDADRPRVSVTPCETRLLCL